MCRKKQLHGWCSICFGLGVLLGHCMDSWALSTGLGIGLILLGFHFLRQK